MARSLPLLKQYITVFHSASFPHLGLIEALEGLIAVTVSHPEQLREHQASILLLDQDLLALHPFEKWENVTRDRSLIICEEAHTFGDLLVPMGWPQRLTGNALQAALAEWTLRLSRLHLRNELVSENAKIAQLTSIAQDLSAETNLDRLLTKILTEGRHLACADAASLFLIDRQADTPPALVFKLTQNDSITFPFEEKRFPIDARSIAGFVAVTGKISNIPDVYQIGTDSPYVFNRTFDEKMGYRTRSMITIPMLNHEKEKGVIGVLQFLNRKSDQHIKLKDEETTLAHTLPFSEDLAELLMALASQAAIAIENANLIAQVQRLFEGFVKASVTAIEQRDPTTSGHSFRVANLTTNLALAVEKSDLSRFDKVYFDDESLREIRYASLLHDFGKVGVREHVLVKADKLPERGLDLIRLRFAAIKESIRNQVTQARLDYALQYGREAYHKVAKDFDERLHRELQRLGNLYLEIEAANKPSILPEDRFGHLETLRDSEPLFVDDMSLRLLTDDEFLALSVTKGSLTQEERLEIESHVRHTFEFLTRIPWTPDLKGVPEIAYAHHEKLDGTGYPRRLGSRQIPLPSKMMTIADIYDALTASDRPYKPAVPRDRALNILNAEAKRGLLDTDLVKIFIDAAIFDKSEENIDPYNFPGYTDRFIQRNTCDYELPEEECDHDHD